MGENPERVFICDKLYAPSEGTPNPKLPLGDDPHRPARIYADGLFCLSILYFRCI